VRQENTFSLGNKHGAAITTEGKVVCWGDNRYGQCSVPPTLENVVSICCGYFDTVAVTQDGSMVLWGRSNDESW
jgi:alpha-tubulin suppressor-like RCC1 family protein